MCCDCNDIHCILLCVYMLKDVYNMCLCKMNGCKYGDQIIKYEMKVLKYEGNIK